MSVRDQDEWGSYLGEILALLDQLPEGARVGGKDKTEVQTLRTRLTTAQDAADAVDKVAGFAHATLTGVIDEIDVWGSKVLPSVVGEYGAESPQAKLTPRKTPERHGGGGSTGGSTSSTPVPA